MHLGTLWVGVGRCHDSAGGLLGWGQIQAHRSTWTPFFSPKVRSRRSSSRQTRSTGRTEEIIFCHGLNPSLGGRQGTMGWWGHVWWGCGSVSTDESHTFGLLRKGGIFKKMNNCALGAWISPSLDSSRAGSFYCCFLSREAPKFHLQLVSVVLSFLCRLAGSVPQFPMQNTKNTKNKKKNGIGNTLLDPWQQPVCKCKALHCLSVQSSPLVLNFLTFTWSDLQKCQYFNTFADCSASQFHLWISERCQVSCSVSPLPILH